MLTVRICRSTVGKIWRAFGVGVLMSGQLGGMVIILSGLYLGATRSFTNPIELAVALVVTLTGFLMFFLSSVIGFAFEINIFAAINNRFKLFGWRDDC